MEAHCEVPTNRRNVGVWFKGGALRELIVNVIKRNPDGTNGGPYALPAGSTAKLLMRSVDRPGQSYAVNFTIDGDGSAGVVRLTNPGSGWTPTTGSPNEKFLGYIEITKGGISDIAPPILELELAPMP